MVGLTPLRGRSLPLTTRATNVAPHTDVAPRRCRIYVDTYEQALVSLKLKKIVDAGVGRTFVVIIEGG